MTISKQKAKKKEKKAGRWKKKEDEEKKREASGDAQKVVATSWSQIPGISFEGDKEVKQGWPPNAPNTSRPFMQLPIMELKTCPSI